MEIKLYCDQNCRATSCLTRLEETVLSSVSREQGCTSPPRANLEIRKRTLNRQYFAHDPALRLLGSALHQVYIEPPAQMYDEESEGGLPLGHNFPRAACDLNHRSYTHIITEPPVTHRAYPETISYCLKHEKATSLTPCSFWNTTPPRIA
jgi:hypothetical protein